MTFKTHRITWRELVLQGGLLVLLLAALFPATFLHGEIILPGGMLLASPPWSAYAPEGFEPPGNWLPRETLTQTHYWFKLSKDAIRDGDWPFWNHLQFGGMPLLANFQSAVFFPLRLLHLFLDINTATTLYFLLRLWLCGFFAYICARTFRISPLASSFASFAYMASSYNITWMYWPLPGVAAFLPLVLLAGEDVIQQRYRRGFFVFVFAATMVLLAGHPETAFTGCFGIGLYVFIRLAFQHRDHPLWKPLLVLAAAWALVLAVCAIQILPFLEYVPNSHAMLPDLTRASAAHYALPLQTAILFFVPRFFGMTADNTYWLEHPENSNLVAFIYPGIVVWSAVFLLTAKAPWKAVTRRRVTALTICVIVEALLSFDIDILAPLHRLPLLEWLWQRYHMTFAMLALPLLGAFGIDHWLAQPRRLRDIRHPALCLAIPLATTIALYAFFHSHLVMENLDDYVLLQILLAFGLLGLSFVALLMPIFCRNGRIAFKAFLCILICVDLTLAARNLLPTAPRSWMYPPTELTSAIQNLERPNRLSVFSAQIEPGLLQMYGIEQLWGSDGICPGRILRLLDESYPENWEKMEPLCSVNYYLFREKSHDLSTLDSRYTHVMTLNGVHVTRNTLAYDRAFLVPRLEVVENLDALFDRMKEPDFDPKSVALTEVRPKGPIPDASSASLGSATVVARSRNDLAVQVDAKEPCLLVVTDAYYPGWRAFIDGKQAELLPVYYAFRGVVVPEGEHTVTFSIAPPVFYVGLWVSVIALSVGLLAAIVVLWQDVGNGKRRGSGMKGLLASIDEKGPRT